MLVAYLEGRDMYRLEMISAVPLRHLKLLLFLSRNENNFVSCAATKWKRKAFSLLFLPIVLNTSGLFEEFKTFHWIFHNHHHDWPCSFQCQTILLHEGISRHHWATCSYFVKENVCVRKSAVFCRDAVWSGRSLMFRKNILPPSSGYNSRQSKIQQQAACKQSFLWRWKQ
jgi:hypothetical protein